jgi:glycosyltransferase involved in cell wall biosynthesis
MRFIIFGVGRFYQNRKNEFERLGDYCNETVFFFDNRADIIDGIDGREVKKPYLATHDLYDKILLMSVKDGEMRSQLVALGYDHSDIWSWNQYKIEMSYGKFEIYCGTDRKKVYKRRILIVTTSMNYNGGTIAATYAARCLAEDNEVLVVTHDIDMRLANELKRDGINIMICKVLPYIGREEKYVFSGFDLAIVNVFQMLPVAIQLSKFMPVLWWIHENSNSYDIHYVDTRNRFPEYDDIEKMKRMRIMAVSDIARKNFEFYYPNRIDGVMTFGIPDEFNIGTVVNAKHKKTIFAVIGGICERKGQIVLAKSLEYIAQSDRQQVEFWLIGDCIPGIYYDEVRTASEKHPEIKIIGAMDRKRLREVFTDIDVILCPSLEETMSIAVVEGMMNMKVCVATDKTGISEYITDGVNGFVCEASNAYALARVIERILHNKDNMESVKENARKTYEEYFTMEKFEERLNKEIEATLEKYLRVKGKL